MAKNVKKHVCTEYDKYHSALLNQTILDGYQLIKVDNFWFYKLSFLEIWSKERDSSLYYMS